METAGSRKVKEKDGVWGTVVPASPPLPSSAAQVVVHLESGQQLLVPTDLSVPHPDGSFVLSRPLAALAQAGSKPAGPSTLDFAWASRDAARERHRTPIRRVGQESVSLQACVPWYSSGKGLM